MSTHKETKAEATERKADEAEDRAEAKAEAKAEKAEHDAAAHPPKAAKADAPPKPKYGGTQLLKVTDPQHPKAGTVCKIDGKTTVDETSDEFVYNLLSADNRSAFNAKESQLSPAK